VDVRVLLDSEGDTQGEQMKKDIKAWAIKLRGRSFHQGSDGNPFLYATRANASIVARRIGHLQSIAAEVVRVKARIEEVA
jgi:hypothetical protein